ncbi:restriction endonuclease [Gluconacetobacter sacchari DSM 12717]|uniref:Restriction endonuclease n=2 Tax=Gluconacetobacter sacchari TaxID=92759 RepID=A0A7W4IGX5_9PROT|nr:restriction endonuclease [Gluconacetobacter sacchari]MBB2162640.1 restriction endonuclease [Gluconacetobacter sacchari]GBQ22903.1 restriction endonuclease [Gluconacetobacter sacchari DSM 12717]
MTVPDYQSLMLPVLRLAATGTRRVPEIAEAIADELALSPEDRAALLPSGTQRLLPNRVHWAKTYLMKAGLLSSPARGQFTITSTGRDLLASGPSAVTRTMLEQYPSFVSFVAGRPERATEQTAVSVTPHTAATESQTPEERIEAAHTELMSELRADLLDQILQQSPAFFEQLIVDLLVAMGYGGSHEDAAKRIGGTGDGGVDGVINEDRLGLDRIYVQAKRYAAHLSIGRPDIQAFVGSLVGHGSNKGVFVTTSSFSAPAMDFVRHLSQRVILIDGAALADLMIEHGVGVRVSRAIEIKRVDLDFFDPG